MALEVIVVQVLNVVGLRMGVVLSGVLQEVMQIAAYRKGIMCY